jgi:hypothetical protein
VATAVRQSGNTAKILNFTGYDQTTISTEAARQVFNGSYFSTNVLFDASNSAIAHMYDAFAKHIPSYKLGTLPDFGLLGGYLSADLMVRGLKDAGANPTRTSFIDNLRKVTDYTAGGVLPSPTSLANFGTVDMLPKMTCIYFVQLQGDKFVSVGPGGKAICGKLVPYKGSGS